jgi:hypothetical protein
LKSSIDGIIKVDNNKGSDYRDPVGNFNHKEQVSSDIIGWRGGNNAGSDRFSETSS